MKRVSVIVLGVLFGVISGCGGGGGGADASVDAGSGPCDGHSCGAHGECAVAQSGPVCVCDVGYAGETCGACYPGYHDDGSGACVLDERCMATSCAGAGTCDDASGTVVCTCDEGSTGDHCEECASGYHASASGCVADELCAVSDPCGDHGTCDDAGGEIVCACDAGHAGETCERCYPGYHDDGTGACVLDERCMPTSCAGAGTCDDASGTVVCACDEGSTGDHCEECASGYHASASGCVADERCAISDPCGDHGTCDDAGGEIVCACDAGYTGATCGACYPGYHDDGSGACVLDERCSDTSCSAAGACDDTSGSVVCACDAGFAGAHCETCASGYHRDASGGCAADAACAADSCTNGTCDDTGGVVRCICAMGYAGPTCAICADGYRDAGTGACVLVQECDPTACAGHGACDDAGGVVTCACDAGYAGARCASCASGYHRDADDACVPDASCAAGDPCGAHGTCVDAGGVVSCACDAGYTGDTCTLCYPGYHANGAGGCVLDETCLPGYCAVNGSCDDSSGAAICTCDPGFLHCGASCDEVVPGSGTSDQRYVASDTCGTISYCYGQSFTAGRTGYLTRIRHSGVSAGTQTLTIYAGGTTGCDPAGAVLHTQTVDSSAWGPKDIVLTTPLPVTAGMTYTFKIAGASSWSHPCDTVGGYAGGRFVAAESWDISFETYVASCP